MPKHGSISPVGCCAWVVSSFYLSPIPPPTLFPQIMSSTDKAARRQKFLDVFPVIVGELTDYLKGEGMPGDAVEWFDKVRSWLCYYLLVSFNSRSEP